MKKIWLLKFPLHAHYEETQEEIKRLALVNELEIIDAKFANDFDDKDIAKDAPKLKVKGAKKSK